MRTSRWGLSFLFRQRSLASSFIRSGCMSLVVVCGIHTCRKLGFRGSSNVICCVWLEGASGQGNWLFLLLFHPHFEVILFLLQVEPVDYVLLFSSCSGFLRELLRYGIELGLESHVVPYRRCSSSCWGNSPIVCLPLCLRRPAVLSTFLHDSMLLGMRDLVIEPA